MKTPDDFCNQIDEVCQASAVELHKRCMMIEEAVEEILLLVKTTRIDDEEVPNEDDTFLFAGENIVHVPLTLKLEKVRCSKRVFFGN